MSAFGRPGVRRARHPAAGMYVWLFLTLAVLYVILTRGHFESTDEIAVFQAGRNLWEQGCLCVDNPRMPNVAPGRGGRLYTNYGAAQSVASLPLYVAGKAVDGFLRRGGHAELRAALAGPHVSFGRGYTWSGEVEIFFADLFNAIVTALLACLFLMTCRTMGAPLYPSLAAAATLALASFVAPQSGEFWQHPATALYVLASFSFLYRDRIEPRAAWRWLAGAFAALVLLQRIADAVALPPLFAYAAANAWLREEPRRGRLRRAALGAAPFALAAAAGVAAEAAINAWRWGGGPAYGRVPHLTALFHNPIGIGLWGFLASPGESVFLYTPALLLLPWTLTFFSRRHRRETVLLLSLCAVYLVFFSAYRDWHGLSGYGPRYMTALVPLLLLPMAGWLAETGAAGLLAAAALFAAGVAVQLVSWLVNWSYIIYGRHFYALYHPIETFLFLPWASPVWLKWGVLASGGPELDTWLLNIARYQGMAAFWTAFVPLAAALAFCAWRLCRAVAAAARAPRAITLR